MGLLEVRHCFQVDGIRTFLLLVVFRIILDVGDLVVDVGRPVVVEHSDIEVAIEELGVLLDAALVGLFGEVVPLHHLRLGQGFAIFGIGLGIIQAAEHRIEHSVVRVLYHSCLRAHFGFFTATGLQQEGDLVQHQLLIVRVCLAACLCGGDGTRHFALLLLEARQVTVHFGLVVADVDAFLVALDRHRSVALGLISQCAVEHGVAVHHSKSLRDAFALTIHGDGLVIILGAECFVTRVQGHTLQGSKCLHVIHLVFALWVQLVGLQVAVNALLERVGELAPQVGIFAHGDHAVDVTTVAPRLLLGHGGLVGDRRVDVLRRFGVVTVLHIVVGVHHIAVLGHGGQCQSGQNDG